MVISCKICLYTFKENDDDRELMYFCTRMSSLLDLYTLAQRVFPRLNLKFDCDSLVCTKCVHMLNRLDSFKNRCFKTEQAIRMYKETFEIDKNCPINLWDLARFIGYSDENQERFGLKLCRTCLQFIPKIDHSAELGTPKHVDFLRNCIKEVYLHPTIDPILCMECAEMTEQMYYYLQVCSHNQNKLYDIERLESGRSC